MPGGGAGDLGVHVVGKTDCRFGLWLRLQEEFDEASFDLFHIREFAIPYD